MIFSASVGWWLPISATFMVAGHVYASGVATVA
jgi:hypothetical protein